MKNDPAEIYADIIALPHHRSTRRVPMPPMERAAQFSSFAALAGHSAAIRETARLTDSRTELSDNAKAALDDTLRFLQQHPEHEVRVTWFVPDARKAGGAYHSICGRLLRVDSARRLLVLENAPSIPLDAVTALEV